MNKYVRKILTEARHLAESRGVIVSLEHGGRHPHLVLENKGVRRILVISSSPRNADAAAKYAGRDVRRVIEEMAK